MFFCDKCRYLFNITKDVESKQIGGRINSALTSLFAKYRAGESVTERDLRRIRSKDLLDDERFETMTKKEQHRMTGWIKGANKAFFAKAGGAPDTKIGSNQAFFICKFCKNSQPIQPGTVIYSKDYSAASTVEEEDYSYAIYDQSLARTRDYICKNSECESHTNDAVKEAAMTKNASYQVVYVCTSCSTYWTSSLN